MKTVSETVEIQAPAQEARAPQLKLSVTCKWLILL
jgi:hypothetical protein